MSAPRSLILAGDVGGTKLNLGLARARGEGVEVIAEGRYESDEFDGLAPAVRRFLQDRQEDLAGGRIAHACFGVAGPVVGERSALTNLPWRLDGEALERELGIEDVLFLNDLEATAYGLAALPEDRLFAIHRGRARGSTRAVIAAGTGLGAAILTEVEGWPRALPTEIGHVDFAPRDGEEEALFDFLRTRHGRVSVERVVSGPGIVSIYEFLRDTGRAQEPGWLADRLSGTEDRGAGISEAALGHEAPIAEAALARFVSAYGAAAGNLALSCLALGGIYVGGGIAPEILPALKEDGFLSAFREKGRMRDLLVDIPIHVILEPRAAMLGAAHRAMMARFFRPTD